MQLQQDGKKACWPAHLLFAKCPFAEEINKRPAEYWSLVMDIARRSNLKRVMRCTQIMGRNEDDDLSAAQIFYPVMQAADIFFLKVLLLLLLLHVR
jgi:tyrosyl-tRNA synthetase